MRIEAGSVPIEQEKMNNFHGHMPGGMYRMDVQHEPTSLADTIQKIYQRCEPFIDQDESVWPEAEKSAIRLTKVAKDVQTGIDSYFLANPDVTESWAQANREDDVTTKVAIIRPIYVKLRERFSRADLIG